MLRELPAGIAEVFLLFTNLTSLELIDLNTKSIHSMNALGV
jgi:hypothetical protein